MEIIETIQRNRTTSIGIVVCTVAGLGLFSQYLRAYPQIGEEEKVAITVDALFTALTCRNIERLDDCEQRLKQYEDDGELPGKAALTLDRIIQRARTGEWESSARTLYDFILAQRRAP